MNSSHGTGKLHAKPRLKKPPREPCCCRTGYNSLSDEPVDFREELTRAFHRELTRF